MACGSAEDLSSGVGTKTIPLKEGEFKENGLKIMKILITEGGLSEVCAAGVVGNMCVESGLNPTIKGDKGTSYGLCQWHNERWDNLKKFKNEKGSGVSELDIQVKFLYSQEMNAKTFLSQENYNNFLSADTPSSAAYYFEKYWERPKDVNASAQKRKNYAQTFYELYQGEKNKTTTNTGFTSEIPGYQPNTLASNFNF